MTLNICLVWLSRDLTLISRFDIWCLIDYLWEKFYRILLYMILSYMCFSLWNFYHMFSYMSYVIWFFLSFNFYYKFSIVWFLRYMIFLVCEFCHMFCFEKCWIYYHLIHLYSHEIFKFSIIKNNCSIAKNEIKYIFCIRII